MNNLLIALFVIFMLYVVFKVYLRVTEDKKIARQQAVIKAYRFPTHIRRAVGDKYPALSSRQLELVIEGLQHYFMVSTANRHHGVLKPTRMPSKVVDEAWHAFMLDSREYTAFCEQAFGEYLHHVPDTAEVPADEHDKDADYDDDNIQTLYHRRAMWDTWCIACELEDIDPISPQAIPLLFAIDEQLGIEDGFYFVLPSCELINKDVYKKSYDPSDDLAAARDKYPSHCLLFPIGVLIMEFCVEPIMQDHDQDNGSDYGSASNCSSCGGGGD